MKMNWSKIALFLSGSFFCGAVSHFILILQGSPVTPYGFHLEIGGNWLLLAFDLLMTLIMYLVHRWFERRG